MPKPTPRNKLNSICNMKQSSSKSSPSSSSSSSSSSYWRLLIYLLSIAIYIHPLTLSPTPSNDAPSPWILITDPKPQLDETHIMSPENHDISPPPPESSSSSTSSSTHYQWMEAWHNDYWGRPLQWESSHKSWRPITVWSFRFLKGDNNNKYKWCALIFGFGARVIAMLVQIALNLVGIKSTHDTMMMEQQQYELRSLAKSIFQRDELTSTSELFIHRFVNVWIHAVLVQLVGVVAQLLFATTTATTTAAGEKNIANNSHHHQQQQKQRRLQQYTQYMAQILFALHPTHVEAVANVANRPHILALLLNVTIVDPTIPFLAVGMLSAAGLLSSETGIFHYPAIVLMMTAIQYRREWMLLKEKEEEGKGVVDNGSSSFDKQEEEKEKTKKKNHQELKSPTSLLLKTFFTLLPRYILLVMTSASYLLYRYINGSLKIPDGLIRPAENPFYHKIDNGQWTNLHRIINYSYVLSLHIMKSFGVEIIGYSHEYGFDCIPEIRLPIIQQTSASSWSMDLRVLLPVLLMLFFIGLVVWAWYGWNSRRQNKNDDARSTKQQSKQLHHHHYQQQQQHDRIQRMLLVLTFFAWLATLFPIAGFLKVGTFVADRLVVASTFGTCIFAGRLIALWLAVEDDNDDSSDNERHRSSLPIHPKTIIKHTILLYLCTNHLAKQTHNRTSEWMDAISLMTSSLKACPRSIKSNLEASKIYSSLVPHMFDFDKAHSLIKTAQSIDPTYCDVHLQYSYVYFQQENYIAVEKELVEALLCPFTMGQAMTNWNRYWKVVLSTGDGAANERYTRYMQRIQRETDKAEKEEAKSKAKKDRGRDEILY